MVRAEKTKVKAIKITDNELITTPLKSKYDFDCIDDSEISNKSTKFNEEIISKKKYNIFNWSYFNNFLSIFNVLFYFRLDLFIYFKNM